MAYFGTDPAAGPGGAPNVQAGIPDRPGRVRMALRLVRICLVVLRHGTGAGCDWVRAVITRGQGRPPNGVGATRLRRALEDLGVGFVKLGQLLAARADLLAERYRSELMQLRENAAAMPAEAVTGEIQASYGRSPEAVFGSISPEPVAAASISQVHAATLPDGRRVAVKIRRPGIVAIVQADLALLAVVARLAARLSRRARLVDPAGMVAELAVMINQEMDFQAEAANATAIRELFSEDPSVVIPAIVPGLSRGSCIVMDFVDGISLGDAAGLAAAGYSRSHLAASVIRANLAMLTGPSCFHADLHPGNLLALPEGRLALLDFGAAGDATSGVPAVTAIVEALASADAEALTEGVLLMTTANGTVDHRLLSEDLDRVLLVPLAGSSLGAVQVGQLLRDLVGVLRRHCLRVNADVTVLLRAVMTCESTARELDPDVSFRRVVVPFLVARAFGLPAQAAGMADPLSGEAPATPEPGGPLPSHPAGINLP